MALPPRPQQFDPDASIVLIGCRGAGKRTLGFIGALHLGRRLITEEHHFRKLTELTRSEYLERHGQDAFIRRSTELLKRMLDTNRKGCILECGMSSLSADAQQILFQFCNTNPVIYIHRDRDHMLRLLGDSGGPLLQIDPSHRNCSNFEYFNLEDDSSLSGSLSGTPVDELESRVNVPSRLLNAQADFRGFLDSIRGQRYRDLWLDSPFSIDALPPEYRQYSSCLRLRLSYLLERGVSWEALEAVADTVELIIDQWPEGMDSTIARQLALIRRNLNVPVLFHVEENPREERRRSDQEKQEMDSSLLHLGLRLGVEYLSLDFSRGADFVTPLIKRKGSSKVMANFCSVRIGAPSWLDNVRLHEYAQAQSMGFDIVRMLRFCAGDSNAYDPDRFKARLDETIADPKPPLVAYDFSVLGARTPLQSQLFCPVKHKDMETRREHLATVAASCHALSDQFLQGRMQALHYYAAGANMSYSLSPAMHQEAYSFSGMPHTFTATSSSSQPELGSLCWQPDFGGASLAAPFKTALGLQLELKSTHATAIGAVNLILPLRGKSDLLLDHVRSRNLSGQPTGFYGDNTDWSAMHTCLRRALSPRNFVRPSRTTGLVIGAGGMARAAIYALLQLGCRRIFIYNRTESHAREVAEHFNGLVQTQRLGISSSDPVCFTLTSLTQSWPDTFDYPTLIVSCVPAISPTGGTGANFVLPKHWIRSPTGGVVVEMAYEPVETPLIAQMRDYRDKSGRANGYAGPTWHIVDGLEVVSEMAIGAFELMTGRPAPKKLMRQVCRRAASPLDPAT